MKQVIFYTPEKIAWLKKHYPKICRAELAKNFNKKFKANKTESAITAVCKRYRIKSGRTGQFKKGNKPWSAGTKGICKPNKTSFKKGNQAHNKKPIGYERIDINGYTQIKTKEPDVFEFKHRFTWEKAYGKIKKGNVIVFINGDKTDIKIGNLEMISQSELTHRNKLQTSSSPQELQPTLKLIAKLKTAAFNKKDSA